MINDKNNINETRIIPRGRTAGFTLLELMIVILLIGILSALISVGMIGARRFFKGLTARQDLDNISRALEEYKVKFGEYPPDAWATNTEVRKHILRRWPQLLKKSAILTASLDYYTNVVLANPDAVLAFWLCGPCRYQNGSTTLLGPGTWNDSDGVRDGFSNDKTNPFDLFVNGANYTAMDSESYEATFLELVADPKSDGSHKGNYAGPGHDFAGGLIYKDTPVVYFRSNKGNYLIPELNTLKYRTVASFGTAVPYMRDVNSANSWINPDSFQLILPGEDDNYGEGPASPGSVPVLRDLKNNNTTADADNVTNFCEGTTLETMFE